MAHDDMQQAILMHFFTALSRRFPWMNLRVTPHFHMMRSRQFSVAFDVVKAIYRSLSIGLFRLKNLVKDV
jgi:hypothetical protein